MKKIKIVIAGGTGLIGRKLELFFTNIGFEVYILTRTPKRLNEFFWDPDNNLINFSFDVDVVINLAGKSINCLFTEENKQQILRSRVNSTRLLGENILQKQNPPQLFIQASAVGYYGDSYEECDENAPNGTGFLAEVCKTWEETFLSFPFTKTKKVIIRIGVFLDSSGGALPPLIKNVKLFLGGAVGNGRQYMSWIHHEDFSSAILHIVQHDLEGIFNLTSPNPVTNSDFMKTLRGVYHRPWSPPVPKLIVRLISEHLIKTEPDLIFSSQRAIPKNLLNSGFDFKFANLNDALMDICSTKN